jgi:tetratricopeptide (TPR) repeat protein
VEPSTRQHEETIIPVKPVLDVGPAAVAAPAGQRPAKMWRLFGIVALLGAAAIAVFVLLPKWVADDQATARQAAAEAKSEATPEAPEPVAPPLSAEEIAALKSRAESLLASLLPQQQKLNAQHADGWGGDDWSHYQELGRNGDDAYLANSFQEAVTAYTQALALGETLLGRSVDIVAKALAAGHEAFAAGNADAALRQFDVVLGIDPDNEAAKLGRAKAERLPEVLDLVHKGDAERAAGELTHAADSYRKALAIDAAWPAARSGLDAVTGTLKANEFEQSMSAGLGALAEQDYRSAEGQFRAALKLRPESKEAQDGLTQAEQGLKLDNIALTQARALAFERRELWDRAIEQYDAALKADPTLVFAQTGLERARYRQGLEAKLVNIIDNPRLLFSDSVLAGAKSLLEEARSQEQQGDRLKGQIAKLDDLVRLATTPVPVELHSDALTEVTLYRVGTLGTFMAKTVELRPGTYTAVGSRNGYRDVRQTFTVLPGRELPPVSVVCVEPI